MFTINDNYLKLQGSYLFSNIAKKVADYQQENPCLLYTSHLP